MSGLTNMTIKQYSNECGPVPVDKLAYTKTTNKWIWSRFYTIVSHTCHPVTVIGNPMDNKYYRRKQWEINLNITQHHPFLKLFSLLFDLLQIDLMLQTSPIFMQNSTHKGRQVQIGNNTNYRSNLAPTNYDSSPRNAHTLSESNRSYDAGASNKSL